MERLLAASDFMVTRLITLPPETDVLSAIERLLNSRVTGAPVVGSGQTYLGVFSEKCSLDVLFTAAEHDAARHGGLPAVSAADIMERELVTLRPGMDAIDAIDLLLSRRISGAPVVDAENLCLGVFSEKTSMSVLLASSYDQRPAPEVRHAMDPDPKRFITEDLDLLSIMRIFLTTPYRRLEVLRDGVLLGQISRRDALASALRLAKRTPDYLAAVRGESDSGVAGFMDHRAKTIDPDCDMLRIATVFSTTPYRRLPVLDGDLVSGIVSRRDLLAAARKTLLQPVKARPKGLYLSAVADGPPPTVA